MESWGPAVLRLAVGAIFVAHGMQKLFGVWGGGGLGGTTASLAQLGLSPAYPLAVVVAVAEFAGGLLLMAGGLTRYVSAVLGIEMAVAIWKVHLAHGFFINWGMAPDRGHGVEFHLALVGALLCLLMTGPGALSVDHARARSAEAEAAGRARLRSRV